MTLDLLVPREGGGFSVVEPGDEHVRAEGLPAPFGLYRDFSHRVWALSPDEVRELDPRWRS